MAVVFAIVGTGPYGEYERLWQKMCILCLFRLRNKMAAGGDVDYIEEEEGKVMEPC